MKDGSAYNPLSSYCEKVTVGHVGKTSPFYRDKGVSFLRTQNIGKGELVLDELKFITPEFHASQRKSRIVPGDVLITRVVTDQMKCEIVPEGIGEANCANIIIIRPGQELAPKFLLYLISSPDAQSYLLGKRVGSAQQVVNTQVLKDWPIRVPPLEEQKRIAAVLDQAFAALDRALAEANLADAAELLDNSVNDVFEGLASSSTVQPLSDAVHPDCKLSYGIVQPGDEVAGGLPVVRPVDLKQRVVSPAGLKTIAPDRADGYARTKLVGNELLLCVRGSTGEISVAADELAGANVTRGIVPIRFPHDTVIPEFAYFQLRSRFAQDQIAAGTYGAALMQINIKDLRCLKFIVPRMERQRDVIQSVEQMYEGSEQLRAAYTEKMTDIADLRQSLLQKAFSGQLT